MSRPWLVLLGLPLGGCAAFVPDPGDPVTMDQRAPLPDEGSPQDLRAVVDLSAPDLRPAPPDLMGLDLSGRYSYVRINEVAPGAAGVAADEYIELAGGAADTPLKDFKLSYQSSTGGLVTLLTFGDVTLPKGGYLLVAATGTRFAGMADATFSAGASGRLARDGGAVGLISASGVRVDSLAWGTTTRDYVEGKAAPAPGDLGLSRYPDGLDTDQNDGDAHVAPLTPKAPNQ